MTPRAGVLVLGHGHIVKMQYFFSSCPHWDMDQPNEVYSNIMKTKENCKFHDPWGRGSCPQVYIRQTKCIVMMNKKGSAKIIYFMTHRIGVLVLKCGHISHIVKMHYFFKIFFSTPSYRSDKLRV